MAYVVTINATVIAERLHEIERGNPSRTYTMPTLTSAFQLANAFAFGAGLAMRKAPRSMRPGSIYLFYWRDGEPGVSIERKES